MSSILYSLSAAQLRRAVAVKEQIEKLGNELASIFGATPAVVPDSTPRRRTMNVESRAKIAVAQKKRWAKTRAKQNSKTVAKAAVKPKRTLSAAVRAKISAGAKARWAKTKAARD
jgi:hypothetical protein